MRLCYQHHVLVLLIPVLLVHGNVTHLRPVIESLSLPSPRQCPGRVTVLCRRCRQRVKVVLLEELAAQFGLKTQDAIDRLQTLMADGTLSGRLAGETGQRRCGTRSLLRCGTRLPRSRTGLTSRGLLLKCGTRLLRFRTGPTSRGLLRCGTDTGQAGWGRDSGVHGRHS